jgi:hypothetical protein
MSDRVQKQGIVKTRASLDANQASEEIVLFNEDGTPYDADNQTYGVITSGSAIGTVGKTTSAAEPAANTIVLVKFTNGNSATSPTLAFGGGSARAMQLGGTASAAAKLAVAAGGIVAFFFDGTVLHQLGTYT